ncbi:hypothetical protein Tco_0672065 [Tanacetum coccineum]
MHMPTMLPGRILVLFEVNPLLSFDLEESLDVVLVVGDTFAVNSLEIILSEDKSFLEDLVGVGIGISASSVFSTSDVL